MNQNQLPALGALVFLTDKRKEFKNVSGMGRVIAVHDRTAFSQASVDIRMGYGQVWRETYERVDVAAFNGIGPLQFHELRNDGKFVDREFFQNA